MSRLPDEDDELRSVGFETSRTVFLARQEAEEELVRAREWFRVTLASIGDGVVTTDTEGKVLSLNHVARELTGWADEEARGRPLGEIFRIVNETTRETVENPAERALREGRVVGLANHTVLIARDGTETPIDDSAAPIRDDHGQVQGIVLIFRSIAQRRQADLARARLAAIVESSQDAIISKTLDTIVRSWNAGAEHLFGYTADEMIGQSITRLIPSDRQDEERMILEKLRRGERIEHYETVRVSKEGRRIDVSLSISPVRDSTGQIIGASKIVRDISDRRHAEQALRERDHQLRMALEAGRMGTWEWDIRTGRVNWSAGLEVIHGLTPGTFGGTVEDFQKDIHPADLQRVLGTIQKTVEAGEDYQTEYRVVLPQGGVRWVEARGKLFRDDSGVAVRMLGVCSDCTDRRRAQETAEFLADASKALAELTDYESTLQKVASLAVPHFADWCAVDMLEPDGSLRRLAVMHVDPRKVQLVHEVDRKYPSAPSDPRGVRQAIRTGKPDWEPVISDEILVAVCKSEEHLSIARELGLKSFICVPMQSRFRILGVLTFVTAESGRSYSEGEVRAAEDLAHRAVIAIENAKLLATLKEADRRKDEFLAMLAHELRNPLAPIRNAAQLFQAKGPADPELQWATEVIERQVHQMSRLVDDLLDVSRITRGKIELRRAPVELADVVQSAVEASRPLIDKLGHQLTLAIPPRPIYLDADATRLAQVLLNLLNNAAKYTDHGGRIALGAERINSHVVIRVKDNGIGISAEMLPRIFEMFTQVDRSLDRSEGGLGIGLTLVQRLVEMHGGSVEARSEGPGKGSEFIVRLPITAGTVGGDPQSDSGEHAVPATRRILVVDDNRDAADTVGMLLRVLGHEVRTAHDGLEAVEAAATFRPNVVLLDIGLPRLNGYEVARRIRSQEAGADALLIALTGWGQEEDRKRSHEAGFDHHITKPIEFKALQKLLSENTVRRST